MKKYIIHRYQLLVILFLLLLNSCEENNDVELLFEDTPTVRIEKKIAEVSEFLQDAENGWKITYFTDSSELGGFTFLFDFVSDFEVKMDSDFGTTDPDRISLYDITLGSTVKLTFTTKNVIHQLSDSNNFPDPDLRGQGYKGSFEFLYNKIDGEDIIFKSNRDRNNLIRFTKATEDDWDNLLTQNKAMLTNSIPRNPQKSVFRNIVLDNGTTKELYSFSFNEARRFATVEGISENAEFSDLSFGLAPTPKGFIVSPEINVSGESLKEFIYNATTDEFVAEVNDVKMTIKYENDLNFLLPKYPFGKEPRGNNSIRLYRTRFPDSDLSSQPFIDFFNEWTAFFTASENGRTISRVYIYDLDSEPFVQIRYLSRGTEFRQNYNCTYTITETSLGNKIIKFTEIAPFNDHFTRDGAKPMLDFLFRDSGFYVQKMVDFNANQNTLGLIPTDDTTILLQWYDF